MEKETFEKAYRIYDRIKEIERNQCVASEILRLADKMESSSLSSEITYKLMGEEFPRLLELEVKRTIEEGLKRFLVSMEAEKQAKEREMEML